MVLQGSSTSWGLDYQVRRKLMLIPVIILAVGVASGADPPAMNQTASSDGSLEPTAMNQTGSSDGSAEPSAIGSEDELRCTRPLIDVVQGFAVTLVSVSVPFWDSKKYIGDGSKRRRIGMFCIVICTPLTDVVQDLLRSALCVLMLWEECKFQNNARAEKPSSIVVLKRLFKSLLPWQKSLARILASTEIVVYTMANSALHTNAELRHKFDMMCSDDLRTYVENEKEALIVGTRIIEDNDSQNSYVRSEMAGYSALLLIRAKVLPDFDQLKFLRGKSGYAMVAIAVQAFGYIYAVVYRSATDLRVTPLEVMGLVFNIGLLIKVSTFSTCNPCQRPLVIYMNHDLDDKLVQYLSERETEDLKPAQSPPAVALILSLLGILSSTGLFLVSVVIYYIVSMMAVSELRVVIPLVLFSVVIFAKFTFLVTKMMCYSDRVLPSVALIVKLNILLGAVVYVWATVVTVKYWDSEHFNTRAHPNLSDLIPFIG